MEHDATADQPRPLDSTGFAPGTSSGVVLGYPDMAPPNVDFAPSPKGAGAKPSRSANHSTTPGQDAKPGTGNAQQGAVERTGPPLPKRPKGRLFIGSTFLAVLVGLGWAIYQSLLRYSAYGTVVGRSVELTAPWDGIVQSVYVREGQSVKHGELLAEVDSFQLRQKIERIDDALRLQRAEMASKLSLLRWEAEKIRDSQSLALSEFYEKWSTLLAEQAHLADLRMQVERIEPMAREGAAPQERLDSLQFQLAGQEKRVEQLTEAVRALQGRTQSALTDLTLDDQIRPALARIENLQADLVRTRQQIRRGEIRAPANGRILRTFRFSGEYANQTTPILELIIDGSTELVVYVPQNDVHDFPIGKTVFLRLDMIDRNIPCQVHRIALRTEPAPKSLSRYYRDDEALLPIYFRLTQVDDLPGWLTLGSKVRLPRNQWGGLVSGMSDWWRGDNAARHPGLPATLEPDQPAPSIRTAGLRASQSVMTDESMRGHGGQTAGRMRRP